jgi:hypothetical protein
MIYVVEFDGTQPVAAGGATVRFRFASGVGFATRPTDSPANTVYPGRLLDPGTFERSVWQPGSTRGAGSVGLGVVTLANADGALDALFDYAFDGRDVVIARGQEGQPRSSFVTVFAGTLEHCLVTRSTVTLRLRDRQGEVAALPLVAARYAGNNVLPQGVEGTAADLKGLPKPVLWGEAENFTPPRVNSSTLTYQISSRAVASITGVYEGGNAITAGTNRGTLAALQATAPTAGTYDYSLGNDAVGEGAYFRLGSTPSLGITCTAAEGASTARTAGQVIQRILLAAGLSMDQVSTLPAFDGKNAATVGWWAGTDAQTVAQALDALSISVGASWIADRTGSIRLVRLEEPASLPATASIAAWQPVGNDGVVVSPTADDDRGVPSYEVAVSWGRNYTVETGGQVAGVVTQARRDFLALEYRTATARDASVWNPDAKSGRHPLSRPVAIETQLRLEADAIAEAARLLALYGQRRRYAQITITAATAAGIDLGSVVTVTSDRLGFAAGRRMLVIGMREELGADRVTVSCWG